MYPIIITGDFNMELDNENFNSFIKDIEKNKITHVDIKGNTWHNKKGDDKALDHIFIPSNWDINDAGIIDSKETSDHDFIYVDVKEKVKSL